jgi:hypothetical protein
MFRNVTKQKAKDASAMIKKSALSKIDRVIKEVWANNISKDYHNFHLLKEDTLKNSFYYHIRRKLGTQFLEENAIRIFTEFNGSDLKGSGFYTDIAIVELDKFNEGYLSENIKSIVAIIELKYGDGYTSDNYFYGDINKVMNYIVNCKVDCLYYLGFIIEKEYPYPKWLDGRQIKNWANKKVAVLSANRDMGSYDLHFYIQSCNGLNKELSNVF